MSTSRLLIRVLAIFILVAGSTAFINIAQAQQILSGSPGSVITYNGHGTPNSNVNVEASSSVSVSVSGNSYSDSLNGINIPSSENSLSISISPVQTINITARPTWMSGIGVTRPGSVSGNTGSYTINNVPAGSYDITVSGTPVSGASTVTMTVTTSQPVSIGSDGNYTVNIDTSGLPASVYTISQGGQEVARVYLGVAVPATPTPQPPASTPQPTVTPTQQPTIAPTPQPTEIAVPTATSMPVMPTTTKTLSQGLSISQAAIVLIAIVVVAALTFIITRKNRK